MTPQNPRFAHDVEALVLSMPAARTLGLRFDRIALGEVDLTLPYQDGMSFRPGQLQATPIFAQGGVVFTVGDVLTKASGFNHDRLS